MQYFFIIAGVFLIALTFTVGIHTDWLEWAKICYVIFALVVELKNIIKNKRARLKYVYFVALILQSQTGWVATGLTACIIIEFFFVQKFSHKFKERMEIIK